ncbi:MAG: hypothetical protein LLG45_09470 [Actinomycetia bacterium]|nr:hypothetical protein [Actinomycetes bacterium]
MARSLYMPEDLGTEVVAPSGYYVPLREEVTEFGEKRLLYVLGSYCIEASCCGVGSWNYLRVEGYIVERDDPDHEAVPAGLPIDTIEDKDERAAISTLLQKKHPGVRIEFR